MKSSIRNKRLSTTIEIYADVPLLYVNAQIYECLDLREAELLYNIIDFHPKVLTYDQVIDRILKKYGIANDLYADPIHYIRKKKLSLCKMLSEATGFYQEEIIVNVRKVGYRLKTGWERIDVFSSDVLQHNFSEAQRKTSELPSQLDLLSSEISSLNNIIEETIGLSNYLELSKITNAQEDVTLFLKYEGHEKTIATLTERFTNIARNILSLLEIKPFDSKYIRILKILETIFSYITMSRQGTNISEETWRTLFAYELRCHYEILVADTVLPCL